MSFSSIIRNVSAALFLVALSLTSPRILKAEIVGYQIDRAATPSPISTINATKIPAASFQSDGSPDNDEGVATLALPFPIKIYESVFDTVNVHVNGALFFGAVAPTGTNYGYTGAFPSKWPSSPNNTSFPIVAPYFDDLLLRDSATDGVFYETTGSAPNREFIVSYVGQKLYEYTSNVNFQVVFTESSNTIRFNYGSLSASDAFGLENAIVGLQSSSLQGQTFAYRGLLYPEATTQQVLPNSSWLLSPTTTSTCGSSEAIISVVSPTANQSWAGAVNVRAKILVTSTCNPSQTSTTTGSLFASLGQGTIPLSDDGVGSDENVDQVFSQSLALSAGAATLTVSGTYLGQALAPVQVPITGVEPYGIISSNLQWYPTQDATPIEFLSGGDDGSNSNVLSLLLPFTFKVNNQPTNSITIGSNGLIQFAAGRSSRSQSLFPLSGSPVASLGALWSGYDFSVSESRVLIQSTGEAPNRIFVITWENLRNYDDSSTAPPVAFQAALLEAQNVIQVNHLRTSVDGFYQTVGLQLSSTLGQSYFRNGAFQPGDIPGKPSNNTTLYFVPPGATVTPQAPLPTPSPYPTAVGVTPTVTPTATVIQSPTATVSQTATATSTQTPSATPTSFASPTSTPTIIATPSVTPTALIPTAIPTGISTVISTAAPTSQPTATNEAAPTTPPQTSAVVITSSLNQIRGLVALAKKDLLPVKGISAAKIKKNKATNLKISEARRSIKNQISTLTLAIKQAPPAELLQFSQFTTKNAAKLSSLFSKASKLKAAPGAKAWKAFTLEVNRMLSK